MKTVKINDKEFRVHDEVYKLIYDTSIERDGLRKDVARLRGCDCGEQAVCPNCKPDTQESEKGGEK